MSPAGVKGCFATHSILSIFANLHQSTRSSFAVDIKTLLLAVSVLLLGYICSLWCSMPKTTDCTGWWTDVPTNINPLRENYDTTIWEAVDTLGRERLMSNIIRWSIHHVHTAEAFPQLYWPCWVLFWWIYSAVRNPLVCNNKRIDPSHGHVNWKYLLRYYRKQIWLPLALVFFRVKAARVFFAVSSNRRMRKGCITAYKYFLNEPGTD